MQRLMGSLEEGPLVLSTSSGLTMLFEIDILFALSFETQRLTVMAKAKD